MNTNRQNHYTDSIYSDSVLELIRSCENRLKQGIYTTVGELAITAWLSKEPVPFAARCTGENKSFKVGDVWGELWDCGWFFIEGKVPAAAQGRGLVMRLDVSGEACVFDNEGRPIRGLTNVHSRNVETLGRFGKTIYHLSDPAQAGEPVGIWVETGCNDLFGHFSSNGKILMAELAVVNPRVRSLFYDFAVLHELLRSVSKDEQRYHALLGALSDVAYNLTDLTDSQVDRALARLRPELEKTGSECTFGFSAVGHAHIDLAWLWPIRETIRKGCRTFATVDYLMNRYPEYKFTCSQPQLYEWMKEYYPDLYGRIKKRVAEGRWECQGAMWVESDLHAPSGESLVRQFLYGKRFFREEFGKDMEICFLPDAFGFTAALPQIMRKSGVKFFFTQKLNWAKVFSYPFDTFNWRGIDGSEVLSHCPPFWHYSSSATPKAFKTLEERFTEKRHETECVVLFGCGDGGGGAGMEHLEALRREKNLAGIPPVRQEFVVDFFHRQEQQKENFHTWTGPLDLDKHTGCLTSQARTKRNNRKIEIALSRLEFLTVLAGLASDYETPRKALLRIWKRVLLNQFHDILPGSSISRVYTEADTAYADAFREVESLTDAALVALVKGIGTNGMTAPAIAVNTLSWPRLEWVKTDTGWHRLSLPPAGYAVFDGTPEDGLLAVAEAELVAGENTIENAVVRVTFTPEGRIASVYDKQNDIESVDPAQPANDLLIYADSGDAWDFPTDYRRFPTSRFALESCEIKRDGPTLRRRMHYSWGRSSLIQDVELTAGSRRVDFVTHVDWQERGRMLRTAFPVNVVMGDAHGEIQFGHVRRETHANRIENFTDFDVAAQKWMDISRRNYGAAVLNDCKYGYRVRENVIDLCLLRSPSNPAPDADAGHHDFTYAFFPHAGDHVTGGVIRAGYELNVPPFVRPLAHVPAPRPEEGRSVVSMDTENVILETVKYAEDSDAVILRLYEAHGKRTRTRLRTSVPIKQVMRTNLLEEPELELPCTQDEIRFEIGPFEIITLALTRKTQIEE
ncbi:MAG TPA: alpha-mannosidase [Verrucomicrobia bacterium]|nr:alpha-mannosidase [Verrucomicrobiota bacterium]